MKLLERYLYAISRQLPKEGSEEIITELRSSLLDTIEGTYGESPSDQEVTSIIKSFGSPSSVAKQYGKSKYIINASYTDLFILIMKIIVLGMLGAFTIAFVVKFLSSPEEVNIGIEFASILGSTLTASISAFGSLTLVFMIISRVADDKDVLEEDWTPIDLEEIPTEKQKVKFGETLAGIVFSVIFLVAFNMYPGILNLPSTILNEAGLNIHSLDITRFNDYLMILNVVWISTIIHAILLLVRMKYTKALRLAEIIISFASVALFYVMITDLTLYTGPSNYYGPKGLFTLIAVLTGIEIISHIIKFFIQD